MREAKVASEPEILIEWFRDLGIDDADRAGGRPLSQWLYARACGMWDWRSNCSDAYVQDAFKVMPVRPIGRTRVASPRSCGSVGSVGCTVGGTA